jgi:hypothetical protein
MSLPFSSDIERFSPRTEAVPRFSLLVVAPLPRALLSLHHSKPFSPKSEIKFPLSHIPQFGESLFWILISASFTCFDRLQKAWNCQLKEHMFLNAIGTTIIKTSNKNNMSSSDSASHYSEKSFSQLRNVGFIPTSYSTMLADQIPTIDVASRVTYGTWGRPFCEFAVRNW